MPAFYKAKETPPTAKLQREARPPPACWSRGAHGAVQFCTGPGAVVERVQVLRRSCRSAFNLRDAQQRKKHGQQAAAASPRHQYSDWLTVTLLKERERLDGMAAGRAEAEACATRRAAETRKGKQRSVVDAAACGEGNCRFMSFQIDLKLGIHGISTIIKWQIKRRWCCCWASDFVADAVAHRLLHFYI